MPPSRPVLRSLAEARAWVAALGPRLPPAAVPSPALASDLVVTEPVPAVATARRAGWAVPAEATLGASPYGPVPVAGLRRVEAGEAMPPGTDAVLPPEHGVDHGAWGEVTASAAPGEGVVQAGGHLAEGQLIARAGTVPPLLPRAAAAAMRREGGRMRELLAAATPSGITLGPVALAAIGGIAARPIEETLLGSDAAGRPAIALPADPAALLLAWCALVAVPGASVAARLSRKIASPAGLADLVPVRLAGGEAVPLAVADAPSLAAVALADGWIEVPPESEGHREGSIVTVILHPSGAGG